MTHLELRDSILQRRRFVRLQDMDHGAGSPN
jgi:hypothetical protein